MCSNFLLTCTLVVILSHNFKPNSSQPNFLFLRSGMVNQHFPKYVLHNSHLGKLILYKNISMVSSLECEAKIPLNKNVLLKDSQETVDMRRSFKSLKTDTAGNAL